jgi:hypothetical protein
MATRKSMMAYSTVVTPFSPLRMVDHNCFIGSPLLIESRRSVSDRSFLWCDSATSTPKRFRNHCRHFSHSPEYAGTRTRGTSRLRSESQTLIGKRKITIGFASASNNPDYLPCCDHHVSRTRLPELRRSLKTERAFGFLSNADGTLERVFFSVRLLCC